MHFNTPSEVRASEVRASADRAALEDALRSMAGLDINPYSTPSNRCQWQRGFSNASPNSWEGQMDLGYPY